MIELTCPAEEGIEPAQLRKAYDPLKTAIEANGVWSVADHHRSGSRGYVAHSLPRCLKKLGLCLRSVGRTCKEVSIIAARCTYAIYLAHVSKCWDRKREILTSHTNQEPAHADPV